MLTAATAEKYANPEFLLHAVLDSIGGGGERRLPLLVRGQATTIWLVSANSLCSTRRAMRATSKATLATAALPSERYR